MLRVRCPECGAEAVVAPQHGEEIVAVYCVTHKGGADGHIRPVYMVPASSPAIVAKPEPVAA
jgi:hypothetical protein